MESRDTLTGSPLFAHLEPDHLALLAAAAAPVAWPQGEVPAGERHGCLLLADGELELRRDTPYGPFRVRRVAPGALVGETAWLGHPWPPYDVVATAAVRALRLPPAFAESWPATMTLALLWTVWKSQSAKLRAANGRLVGFFANDAATVARAAAPPGEPDASVRVGLEAKRGLFAEQPLSSLEINFLTTLSREERYRHGEVIFREGDAGVTMYVVLDGQVRISKHIPGVGEEALAFLGRGSFFGEMALIDREPRSATAVAHEGDAILLAFPRDVVGGLLDFGRISSARLLRLLCEMLARRLGALDEKLAGWHILAAGSPTAPF